MVPALCVQRGRPIPAGELAILARSEILTHDFVLQNVKYRHLDVQMGYQRTHRLLIKSLRLTTPRVPVVSLPRLQAVQSLTGGIHSRSENFHRVEIIEILICDNDVNEI